MQDNNNNNVTVDELRRVMQDVAAGRKEAALGKLETLLLRVQRPAAIAKREEVTVIHTRIDVRGNAEPNQSDLASYYERQARFVYIDRTGYNQRGEPYIVELDRAATVEELRAFVESFRPNRNNSEMLQFIASNRTRCFGTVEEAAEWLG